MSILSNLIVVLAFLVVPLFSVSAPPFPFEIEQPDGSKIPVRMFGHEYYNWMETEDGYVIDWVEDDTRLGWHYSKLDEDGKFTASDILVTYPAPDNLYIQKRLREISPKVRDLSYRLPNNKMDFHNHLDREILDYTLKPLVFLVEFSDEDHEYTEEHFENLLFSEDLSPTNFPPGHEDYTMSVKEYYDEISNGKQEIIGDIGSITPWRPAKHNYSYYVDGVNGTAEGDNGYARSAAALVVETAMALDDEDFDFSKFENEKGFIDVVILIVAGKGGSQQNGHYFWPHMFYVPTSGHGLEDINPNAPSNSDDYFSPGAGDVAIHKYIVIHEQYPYWGSSDETKIHPIGTICHELGHVLGLPDLYDNSDSRPGYGIGKWGLMGSGNYQSETSPAYMSAWSRYRLGFIVPDTLSYVYDLEITIPPPLPGSDVGAAYILPMSSNIPQEYLIIENRQNEGSDKNLIESGLLVWHIDETITDMYPVFSSSVNIDHNFYGVNLLQADGYGDLYSITENDGDSGDPFPGSTVNREITTRTNPNTSLYTYDRDADGIADTGGESNIRLTNIMENSDNSITLTAYNPNRGILISYDEAGYEGWGFPKADITWAGIRLVAPENSMLSGISTIFPSGGSVREYTINIWKGWTGNMPDMLLFPLNGIVNWNTDPDNIRNGGWANISVSDTKIILDKGETYYVEIHLEGGGFFYPFDYGKFANSEPSGMSYGRSNTQENCQSFPYGDWNIRVSLNPDFCNVDCLGICDGTAEFDDCGVCGGDGICDGGGCMDTDACNYFAEAEFDDGSCVYAEQNNECDGSCAVDFDCTGECGGNAVIDECGQCDGPGAIYECGCVDIDEDISCDCDGNILDCDSVCGGDNTDCYMATITNLIPEKFSLYQNYPNPFNSATQIQYDIPEYSKVLLRIYDITGRKIAILYNGYQTPGHYTITWNASEFVSGLYILEINVISDNKSIIFRDNKKILYIQ